jgi:3-phenylpropionate/trans-cinnamate dioxygenase ferredoxin reductase subunit
MALNDIVIVGAGEAGARAAIGLRGAGFSGRVTLIGDELHAPYERPPLSKAAIVGADAPALPAIGDAKDLANISVERVAGVCVTEIDPRGRAVRLADGRSLTYDRLLLATGARARTLPLPGAEHVLTLRTYEDAQRIRDRLRASTRAIIVGGGFIGLELASSARALGCEVVVLEADSRLLRRSTPASLAASLEARHAREGVEIVKDARIERFEKSENGVVVHLADRALEADVVIAGVGAAPRTELAAAAGLTINNGIAVDAHLRTSDPDIFAVGDCASFPHPLFGDGRIRLEAWRNALDQGAHVARTLLGVEEPFSAMPWFWSDQFDITLQIAGMPQAGETSAERDLGGGAALLFHLDAEGRLVGAGGLGPIGKIGKEIKLAERLIARRARPPAEALADAGVNLKKLL